MTPPATDITRHFAPYESLAAAILPHLGDLGDDAAHDIAHLLRVWRLAKQLQQHEGGNLQILAAATLLHDCVNVPKESPLRAQASTLSAQKAAGILAGLGIEQEMITAVCHAITAHSFSANIAPTTLEANILQDADRLDALGMIGVARCFYVAGRLGRPLYDWQDPQAQHRELDDRRFTLDHFYQKLLVLQDQFQTTTGRNMARQRHTKMQQFVNDWLEEI